MRKIIYIALFFQFIILPLSFYTYAKTLWKWNFDCMVEYVRYYYPHWEVYEIIWWKHIDVRWLEYLDEWKEVYWCFITDTPYSFIVNTPYCFWTYAFERVLFPNH